jgi:DNA polymerase III epsilon subunit-like protein
VAGVDVTYVSVDAETDGPVPGRYSLLSIGACLVDDPTVAFYAELRPTTSEADPAALEASRLSLEHLSSEGESPATALPRFAEWAERATRPGTRPLFVAFNAPFDWMFVAEALHRFAGRNPFGYAALDVKALAMGALGISWPLTTFSALADRFGISASLPHHALEDARLQAELFRRILSSIEPLEEQP